MTLRKIYNISEKTIIQTIKYNQIKLFINSVIHSLINSSEHISIFPHAAEYFTVKKLIKTKKKTRLIDFIDFCRITTSLLNCAFDVREKKIKRKSKKKLIRLKVYCILMSLQEELINRVIPGLPMQEIPIPQEMN